MVSLEGAIAILKGSLAPPAAGSAKDLKDTRAVADEIFLFRFHAPHPIDPFEVEDRLAPWRCGIYPTALQKGNRLA